MKNRDFLFLGAMEHNMNASPKYATQKRLAAHFGVTGRRVRQLIEAHIFPSARDRHYDLAICRERYDLFRNKRDRTGWDDFYRSLEARIGKTEKLIGAALEPTSKAIQVREASRAVQDVFSDLRFITAVRSKSDAERELFLGLWCEREDAALGILLSRAAALITRVRAFKPYPRDDSRSATPDRDHDCLHQSLPLLIIWGAEAPGPQRSYGPVVGVQERARSQSSVPRQVGLYQHSEYFLQRCFAII
jgi:hypothetical protein